MPCNISPRNYKCFKDIAAQLIDRYPGNNLSLVFGGGLSYFLPCPQNVTFERTGKKPSCRKDGRNLIDEYLCNNPKRHFLKNRADLQNFVDNLPENSGDEFSDQVLGLFADSHLDLVLDRKLDSDQPNLIELAEAAVKILSRNKNGFFLFVEGDFFSTFQIHI